MPDEENSFLLELHKRDVVHLIPRRYFPAMAVEQA